MAQNSSRAAGRHFLQIPGPTPVPDRVLRALDRPVIDHRGPEFAKMAKQALEGIKTIFKTANPVIIYTATGTGAWEGALVNTLSPGDRVLMVETGQFATLWKKMADKFGIKIHSDVVLPGQHHMLMVLEADSQKPIDEYMQPFSMVGSVDVKEVKTCEEVVETATC